MVRVRYEDVKIKPQQKRKLELMLTALKPKLSREGYEETYSGLVDYVFDKLRNEVDEGIREIGIKIPKKLRLSDL